MTIQGASLTPSSSHRSPATSSNAQPYPEYFQILAKSCASYMSKEDVDQIFKAYLFAAQAHATQFRSSGEPYITHPVAVANICATWKLDVNALMAALLHDTIEDQDISKEEIAQTFNSNVANLVDGLTKLDKIQFASKAEQQAESFRKMLLAMSKDIRVMLIKLADRLHNMSTLEHCDEAKRRRIAKETLDIYAPIANRLGLNALVRQLQDLCFAAQYPFRYKVLKKGLQQAKGTGRGVLQIILQKVQEALPQHHLEGTIKSSEKSLFSIYHKMVEQKKTLSEVLDIYGFSIIVNTLEDCYLCLGILHQLYRPVPGKFKDYIAIPKVNGYKSLHTTLVGPYGTPVEFQIRTKAMDQVAENGVASHWIYKNTQVSLEELQQQTHRWMQSLLDIQNQTTGESTEFIDLIKVDLVPEAVFVLTPKGKIISLPRHATVIDFAYMIHTQVGNHAVAAKINGEWVPLDTSVKSGDTVEVITEDDAVPNIEWLNFVRTGKARAEIRYYLRHLKYQDAVEFGRKLLSQALDTLQTPYPADDHPAWQHLISNSKSSNIEEILAEIGLGYRLAAIVAHRFVNHQSKIHHITAQEVEIENAIQQQKLTITGKEGQTVQFAHCCNPIPGDPIIATIHPGRGLIIHLNDCPVAKHQYQEDPSRWTPVMWDQNPIGNLPVRLNISIINQKGVIAKIASEAAYSDANITQITMREQEGNIADIQITVTVNNRQQLARVIRNLRHIPQVGKISRVKG